MPSTVTPTSVNKKLKMSKQYTLYDVPVSNNGARIRSIIYKKGLEDHFAIKSPAEVGGLSSEKFKSLNPYCKMPVLEIHDQDVDLALPESQVIESYILDKFHDVGPTLIPDNAEQRSIATLIVRIHDLYMASVQGCLYKPMESAEDRAAQVAQISRQMDIIEHYCIGPFLAGAEMTYADTAIMPTFVFCNYILPRYFGWPTIFENRPKLEVWWNLMLQDPVTCRVMGEVESGLESWSKSNRWQEKGILKDVADSSYSWYPC
jgi:glutathione S-transferase